MNISGHIIDVRKRRIFSGIIHFNSDGIITEITEASEVDDKYILPGFIDAHIHIESSMLTPYEFARIALTHGTVATISDPHEIANVCGMDGIRYMIENAADSPLKIHFGAPSCVPATTFETSGATIDATLIEELMQSDDIWYLAEMMNYPGVLNDDPEIMKKLAYANKYNKPIDGHAPGLKGEMAGKYISHGISTDHECFTLEEALDKLGFGMKILIREGSAAKNYDALHTIIASHTDMVMFCSDDKHPDDLLEGHINQVVKRSLDLGYDLFDVLQIACINPVNHYKIPVGTLQVGDPADFITIDNFKDFKVLESYIDGKLVAKEGKTTLADKKHKIINNFDTSEITASDLQVKSDKKEQPVINAIDGSLITEKSFEILPKKDGYLQADTENDILKIVVLNRYKKAPPAIGFIKNFGLKNSAIASTVAHDSHNIVAVGDKDDLLVEAINMLVRSKGGLSAVSPRAAKQVALPIAGLISDKSAREIGIVYKEISEFARECGSQLHAPYMTLSFMALLVIPKIKMSDLGVFDAEKFQFY